MMLKRKGGWKRGHYHVQIKRWIQNGALRCANLKGGWIRVGIRWKSKVACRRGH